MRSASAVLALVIGLAVIASGCGPEQAALRAPGADDGWVYAPPIPYVPTKDQPIILKNRRLLFGGQAGNEQHEMKWLSPPILQTVAPGCKIAAAVLIQNEKTIAQVVNQQMQVIKNIELSSEKRTAQLWIGDDGHMLVGIGPTIEEMKSIVQRSIYSRTTERVNYEWAYYAPDGERAPVTLKGEVGTVAMFDDGRWSVFSFDAHSDSFDLSMWRKGERLWSKVIQKSRKEDVGFSMSVARGKPPRIRIYTPGGVLEYDLEGREITPEQHQKGDEQ